MFLSTNSLSIAYTFSWEYISISSHVVVCPLFYITRVHKPERNNFNSNLFVWIFSNFFENRCIFYVCRVTFIVLGNRLGDRVQILDEAV